VHPRHPKKEVNEALDHAERLGHLVERTVSGAAGEEREAKR
jgi:hypothetical protein